MARAPDERVEKAKELFKTGMKLVDIANKLDVPAGTIRRWKSTYKWESERSDKNNERSETMSTSKKYKKSQNIPEEIKELAESDLNDRQKLFCIYYVKSFNGTQSYIKAYGCSKETAYVNSSKLLSQAKIKDEIQKLREAKLNQIALSEADMIEYHMRIAFSDMGDYVSFGEEEVPVMSMYGPVKVKDTETGENVQLMKKVAIVRLNDSDIVDTQLIKEIKQGKEGVSIKLVDKCKSLDWLDKYFLMNPMDRHKIEFDKKKYELEKRKHDEPEGDDYTDDGFLDALNGSAAEDWNGED